VGIFDRLDKLADQLGELIVPDDVREHVELGQAYLGAGDLESARRELETALGMKPDHARAAYLLGLAYERMGDVAGGKALFERAAERKDFVEPQLALGQLALAAHDLDGAEQAFRRALDAGPADPDARAEAYRGLGTAHLRASRFDRAVRELRKAVASAPDEPTAQTLLGRALLGKGDLDTARICLERATRKEPAPPLAWASRGEVAARLGRTDEAEKAFRAALAGVAASPSVPANAERTEAEITALLGLARLARAAGKLEEARAEVLRALGLSSTRLELLVELGRIAAEARSPEVALDAFDHALKSSEPGSRALADPRPLLDEALVIALRGGLFERALGYADGVAQRNEGDANAQAALALGALRSPDGAEAAEAALAKIAPLARGRSVEVALAEAELQLRRGQRSAALASLRRAAQLAPQDPRPRARYAAQFQREEPAASDVPGILASAHRLATGAIELAELGQPLGRLREALDRPLVVTVMGEFNAGKSTFVNAFLGEEVAPMGVTPTTATVNLLKYGAERKGRVIYLDESTRELAWGDVAGFLKKLAGEEARRIRLVELLYPLEVLQRINVVDTPGLNSIHPEHEEVARRFIEEADAVIWLFSIDQAAKASEGEALGKIASQGRKILGVLNKIDRASDEERAQIIRHVEQALGDWLETIVPVSAKTALTARRAGDTAALAASNYTTLDATLEERFFSRARQIQRAAALGRVRALLSQAIGLVDEKLGALTTLAHEQAAVAARADALTLSRGFLPAERRRLLEASEEALKICAREVLDFVRPRRSFFGGNEATPADRDFLLSLLEERVTAALLASSGRVTAELARSGALLPGLSGGDAGAVDPVELASRLDAAVYGRYRAFVRGYLRGGAVNTFFSRDLPRLELTEPEVRRALERAAPLDDDIVEAELRQPLRAFADLFFEGLLAAIDQRRTTVTLTRFDLECRLKCPLEALAAVVEAALVSGQAPGA
jgi:small GTP-binding protein